MQYFSSRFFLGNSFPTSEYRADQAYKFPTAFIAEYKSGGLWALCLEIASDIQENPGLIYVRR